MAAAAKNEVLADDELPIRVLAALPVFVILDVKPGTAVVITAGARAGVFPNCEHLNSALGKSSPLVTRDAVLMCMRLGTAPPSRHPLSFMPTLEPRATIPSPVQTLVCALPKQKHVCGTTVTEN